MREAIRRLYEEGRRQSEIASTLGVNRSTVAYHVRRFGVPVDKRFARRYDWAEVQRAHDAGLRALECCKRFGFAKATWGDAVRRGDIIPREHRIPLRELLVAGRKRSRGHIKQRLIREGLKENRCEECGIAEWRGKPLSMALHHVNGDGLDNRLENIVFLCPNCHAQTPNYGGRNGHRKARIQGTGAA
jgi:transposase-like protein